MAPLWLPLASLCCALLSISLIGADEVLKPGEPLNVTWDHRALKINGQRKLLLSAGMHYPRSTPSMWPELFAQAKAGGADLIQTYVFWSGHEPKRGEYNFEDRFDLVRFIREAAKAGLFINLRIGPYACAEWNLGGFPEWLLEIPGIEVRTDNEPFKIEMERFVRKVVSLLHKHRLFAPQGGPIILTQIENEYGNIEGDYGEAGHRYAWWAAAMAQALDTGVPWIMCQQGDAPAYIINTCNGWYCHQFRPTYWSSPKLYTEHWNGWFAYWGDSLPHRPAEDSAFALLRFVASGGTLFNYYMYHGGTSFGRTSGGPWIITSYDYDGPLDEYGLPHEPKYSHLAAAHAAIKRCEKALLAVDEPYVLSLGLHVEAHIYSPLGPFALEALTHGGHSHRQCAAFISNTGESAEMVKFAGKEHLIAPWSVSILPDCKNVIYNTGQVTAPTHLKGMLPLVKSTPPRVPSDTPLKTVDNDNISKARILEQSNFADDNIKISQGKGTTSQKHKEVEDSIEKFKDMKVKVEEVEEKMSFLKWTWWVDELRSNVTIAYDRPLEQIRTTHDESDYLWYRRNVTYNASDGEAKAFLLFDNVRDAFHVFVNGNLQGSAYGGNNISIPISLTRGENELAFLVMTIGLQNYGVRFEQLPAGIQGSVLLTVPKGQSTETWNITTGDWEHQVGLVGEQLALFSPSQHSNVDWQEGPSNDQPLTWFTANFSAPGGSLPLAVDLLGMSKGLVWVNGHLLGRHWPSRKAPEQGCGSCDYRGNYDYNKCKWNCGRPTQRWYHLPRDWLIKGNNTLVVFDEIGNYPSHVAIVARVVSQIYAHVQSRQLNATLGKGKSKDSEVLELDCGEGQVIKSIDFASFGTPVRSSGGFELGTCHAMNSHGIAEKACLGMRRCSLDASVAQFGDLCPDELKSLAVHATCSGLDAKEVATLVVGPATAEEMLVKQEVWLQMESTYRQKDRAEESNTRMNFMSMT